MRGQLPSTEDWIQAINKLTFFSLMTLSWILGAVIQPLVSVILQRGNFKPEEWFATTLVAIGLAVIGWVIKIESRFGQMVAIFEQIPEIASKLEEQQERANRHSDLLDDVITIWTEANPEVKREMESIRRVRARDARRNHPS